MSELYKLATTPTKIWKPFPSGDHNSSVLEDGYFDSIANFIRQVAFDEKSRL